MCWSFQNSPEAACQVHDGHFEGYRGNAAKLSLPFQLNQIQFKFKQKDLVIFTEISETHGHSSNNYPCHVIMNDNVFA